MSRTTIALAIAAAIIAMHVLIVAPMGDSREAIQEQLFVEHRSLMKHERFIAEGHGATEELEALKGALKRQERRIVNEKDPSLAFATIQGKVQDMASGAGLRVNSMKPLAPKDIGTYSRMPLFLDATGDMRGFSSFLKLVDSSEDLLSLDKLSVTVAPRGVLRIKMELSGLMKND